MMNEPNFNVIYNANETIYELDFGYLGKTLGTDKIYRDESKPIVKFTIQHAALTGTEKQVKWAKQIISKKISKTVADAIEVYNHYGDKKVLELCKAKDLNTAFLIMIMQKISYWVTISSAKFIIENENDWLLDRMPKIDKIYSGNEVVYNLDFGYLYVDNETNTVIRNENAPMVELKIELMNLEGSEKQVKWAKDIINDKIMNAIKETLRMKFKKEEGKDEAAEFTKIINEKINYWVTTTSAKEIIDNRYN